jgi:carboxypeptidase Taq
MTMNEKYTKLTELIAEAQNINHCAALIGWDQQTYMPPGAAEERGHMMATLARVAHEMFVSDEIGKLLADLKKELPGLDSDSEEYRIIKVTARDYEKETCVPGEFVAEFAQVTTLAQQAWMEARGKSDFSVFQPHLEKIVEMTRRYISFFPPADHPYDTLLDNFEPGMKTAEVKGIFDA